MRACVCVRLPPAHTLPLLLFCSRQTVALVTQRAPVCWKWEKNAALFIYLSNFFSSFLSKGREYAPRIFSHQEGETEMTSDVTRLEHYWFFFPLCILQIQQLSLLFTSFPPKRHGGGLYEKPMIEPQSKIYTMNSTTLTLINKSHFHKAEACNFCTTTVTKQNFKNNYCRKKMSVIRFEWLLGRC